MREHGFLLQGNRPNVSHSVHGIKRKQCLPRPERGGGQVLFRLVLGRTSLSGSGASLRFFLGLPLRQFFAVELLPGWTTDAGQEIIRSLNIRYMDL